MTRLSVNINKLATIRNARGANNPDIVQWAVDIQQFGAHGITIHPRPDERHITRNDVYELKKVVHSEFNIEGYPSRDFLDMVKEVKPEQVTFVPDPPEVLTSNAGWDVKVNYNFLKEVCSEMNESGIRTSLFMETNLSQIEEAFKVGSNRIELYTEAFAVSHSRGDLSIVEQYRSAAHHARELGMGVNAGHDLDLNNLNPFISSIPFIDEVSIGHALICDALKYGMDNTIKLYLRALK